MTSRSIQRRISAQRKPGIDWEAERREFEAWHKSEFPYGHGNHTSFDRHANGLYQQYEVQITWAAWQKARNTVPKVSFR